jgi:hypothetical protein
MTHPTNGEISEKSANIMLWRSEMQHVTIVSHRASLTVQICLR